MTCNIIWADWSVPWVFIIAKKQKHSSVLVMLFLGIARRGFSWGMAFSHQIIHAPVRVRIIFVILSLGPTRPPTLAKFCGKSIDSYRC